MYINRCMYTCVVSLISLLPKCVLILTWFFFFVSVRIRTHFDSPSCMHELCHSIYFWALLYQYHFSSGVYICIYVYTHMCMYIWVTHLMVELCTNAHVHMHILIYIYIQIHTPQCKQHLYNKVSPIWLLTCNHMYTHKYTLRKEV